MASRLANARERAINPLGHLYPDDDTVKTVYHQADGKVAAIGDRHVLLCWVNHVDEPANIRAIQIVQLSGGPGNYSLYTPAVKNQSLDSASMNTSHTLGDFTRAQRNRIIEIARGLNFNMKSRVNNCCTWNCMLLVAMVAEGLLSQETFDMIDKDVPLRKPEPEV